MEQNFEACNVDYSSDEFFEVFCSAPPADQSELRYLIHAQQFDVIGATPIPAEEFPPDLAERQQQTNTTQQ